MFLMRKKNGLCKVSSQDLDLTKVLRQLSLELQMICSCHPIMAVLLYCVLSTVLLDFSAAFDAINHNILLNRLENYVGIGGIALAWFKSYLSDRYQFVGKEEMS